MRDMLACNHISCEAFGPLSTWCHQCCHVGRLSLWRELLHVLEDWMTEFPLGRRSEAKWSREWPGGDDSWCVTRPAGRCVGLGYHGGGVTFIWLLSGTHSCCHLKSFSVTSPSLWNGLEAFPFTVGVGFCQAGFNETQIVLQLMISLMVDCSKYDVYILVVFRIVYDIEQWSSAFFFLHGPI